jgi:hypothetical protein
MANMNNRTIVLVLSAVLIAAALSGCVQETSEIGTPGGAPQPNVTPPPATPDAAQTAPASEGISSFPAPPMITNWKYLSYHNLSISNAPALDQTARITYSIIPDRDIEILFVQVVIPDDGFELIYLNECSPTWHGPNPTKEDPNDLNWFPTNLSKDKMYQFNATIKAVKTGNWTISPCGSNKGMYISVSEDSACIRDEPFTKHSAMVFGSDMLDMPVSEDMRENMTRTASEPPRHNFTPRPSNVSGIEPFDLVWDGTKWVYVQNRS